MGIRAKLLGGFLLVALFTGPSASTRRSPDSD
jgi:hypothetical protein